VSCKVNGCCFDWDTRLITGVHYSLSGNPVEAQKFLFKSIQKGKPKFIKQMVAFSILKRLESSFILIKLAV